MLSSIFRKTLVVYIAVIALSFGALSLALNVGIKHFLVQQRLQVMTREAQEIVPVVERVDNNPALYPDLEKLMAHDKQVDGTTVHFVLQKGTNNNDGNNGLRGIRPFAARLLNQGDIRSLKAVKQVLSGKTVKVQGPFGKADRTSSLTVGLPIQKNGQVIGALFLHAPVQDIQMSTVTRMILLLAGPIFLLSILILYFTSRRFSQPLIRMSRVAQSIGKGHFKERIDVQSNDEVGQLARTFNQMAEQLERLDEMRKELIGNVSHELRTPLTSVRGFVQGMMEGVIPPADREKYLAISYKELNRLTTILNTMLDLSAIETGRISLERKPVQWSTIVDSVAESVKVRMDEKNIKLEIVDPPPTASVWGDAERLQQVLFNIVDNAIRHTSSGCISIASTAIGGCLEVRISDTGEGIAPDKLPHIFERFYTGGKSRADGKERSGLGLTITKHLIELMGGQIAVESSLGRGTTFSITFPTLTYS